MFDLLKGLGVDVSGFDRWGLAFPGLEGAWPWIMLAAALAAGVAWTWSSVKEVTGASRIGLAILQTLILVLLLGIFARPVIRLGKASKIKDRVVVLLDESESMGLPSGDPELTRLEAARKFIDKNEGFFDDLEKKYAVSYFGFDLAVRERGRDQWPDSPEGSGTDLLSALSRSGGGASPLAGVVIVSDGADTERIGRAARDKVKAGVKRALEGFPAPVNSVSLGGASDQADLSIVKAARDDYGFVHNPFQVVVRVRSEGGAADRVPVIFKQGAKTLASKTVVIPPGETEAEAELSFTPRQVGEFMFSVEVPAVKGELTERNNVVRFPLKVLRDKVRVLFIVGNPSWDERFLRRALKKNPSVDLVSFYILREHWDDYEARQQEVSLIAFPTDELFTEELNSFDLVIWQNFRGPFYMYGKYEEYMSNLYSFVRERGGALLMIGGQRGYFGDGRLDPKLLDLLPVVPVNDVPNYEEGEFKARLTEAGKRHPIMEVGEGGDDPSAAWAAMPELEGYNRVAGPAPDSVVLLEHPFEKEGENPLPILAVREVGEGRVMAVMTDESWAWNFAAVGEGLSNKPYQRFWENSIRWLLRDPELRRVTLGSDKGQVAPGEPVTLVLEVLDDGYQPTDGATPKIEVIESPAEDAEQKPELEKIGVGKYRVTIAPAAQGGYRLRASATLNGRSLGYDDALIESSRDNREWIDVSPRPDVLAAIAAAAGGGSISFRDGTGALEFKDTGEEIITGTMDLPLWDNWPTFGLSFSLMVACWYLRRKWGLR